MNDLERKETALWMLEMMQCLVAHGVQDVPYLPPWARGLLGEMRPEDVKRRMTQDAYDGY
jgi:hypothetical protein